MASGLEAESFFAFLGNFTSEAWLADERMSSWRDLGRGPQGDHESDEGKQEELADQNLNA
jgi:hypothetical protein